MVRYTSDPTACVDITVGQKGAASLYPVTTLTLFRSTAGRFPTSTALALKRPRDGVTPQSWKIWTFKQYWSDCVAFAKSLIHLDVKQHGVLNIIGFNSVCAYIIL